MNDAIKTSWPRFPGRLLVGAEIPARNAADMSRQSRGRRRRWPCRRARKRSRPSSRSAQARQPVVTQGGLTGLAAGAHPGEGEVALSLEKMTGIEELDRDSNNADGALRDHPADDPAGSGAGGPHVRRRPRRARLLQHRRQTWRPTPAATRCCAMA